MAYPQSMLALPRASSRRGLFYAIAALWGLVGVCAFTILISEFGFGDTASKYYLLPWCLATGGVVLAPSLYLIYKGRFHPFHPLVFPAWSYFFPGFFIGGLVVALGQAQPYVLSLVQDETTSLPLTFIYVMLGFGGLAVGFSVPYARRFGEWIGSWLPKWEIPSNRIVFPSIVLMCLGIANTFAAFALGILGFQKVEDVSIFDGMIYLLSLFLMEASFLLWLFIFRSKSVGLTQIVVMGILLATAFAKSAFQGNRGSLLTLFVVITFAYSFSGRKLTGKHYAVGAVFATIALAIGMIYGTTFRSLKGTEEQISIDQYATLIPETLSRLSTQDPSVVLSNGMIALTDRIDAVSPLAVVVSNYEALAPYEEVWGINNNIYNDSVTFFIPRLIWPDKPVAIEPSRYGDLYFNFSENSFTITPMGDLLRNFGPIGVPIGMFVIGMLIRTLYASLVEGQTFSYWRVTLFFMMFTSISFEGTCGLIIPILFKVGIISFCGLVVVRFFAGSLKQAT